MLTPSEVIPHLQSDDRIVREYALTYLRSAAGPAPLTADDLWQALDKFGEQRQTIGLAVALEKTKQTDQSLCRTLEAITRGPAEGFVEPYQAVLREISLPLLEAHEEELLGFPLLGPDIRAHLVLRLALRDQPADSLWDWLMKLGTELADAYDGGFDASESDALIDALGQRADEDICQKALAVLNDPTALDDWRMIFALDVLGPRRYEPAISRFVELLGEDADLIPEKASEALSRIGSTDVIDQILQAYPAAEWSKRLGLSDALAGIKRPESEAGLLKLLEIEPGNDLIVVLLQELTMLGSLAALEQSRSVMRASDNPETRSIAQNLLAIAAIKGVDLPEAPAWRAVAEFWLKKWDSNPLFNFPLDFDSDEPEDEEEYEDDAYDPNLYGYPMLPTMAELSPREDVIEPIRRGTPKVGRNDPCPCGSGKKYKKCCLGKDGL